LLVISGEALAVQFDSWDFDPPMLRPSRHKMAFIWTGKIEIETSGIDCIQPAFGRGLRNLLRRNRGPMWRLWVLYQSRRSGWVERLNQTW
jgi:hypothetical protein